MSVREVGGQLRHCMLANIPLVVFPAISFEHASLSVNHLHLQNGRIAFCINFPDLAVNLLTPNAYLAPHSLRSFRLQSAPRNRVLALCQVRCSNSEHTMGRQPEQEDMAGVAGKPRRNDRAVRLL